MRPDQVLDQVEVVELLPKGLDQLLELAVEIPQPPVMLPAAVLPSVRVQA